MVVATAGMFIIAFIGQFRKTNVNISEQPLDVKVVEELHKQFAGKEAFDKHVEKNDEDHREIFSKIGGVERGANGVMDNKETEIWKEVRKQGKCIAGLEKETQIQNQSLAALQSDIKRILERLPRH